MKLSPADCKVEFHRNRITGEITRVIYQPSDRREPSEFATEQLTDTGVDCINDAFQMCGVKRFSGKASQ